MVGGSMLHKLLGKYSKLGSPVKASFWFMVSGFLQKGISMLTTPIFTRIMTETEYGRYSVYNSWYNIISIIVTLNLAAGVYTRGLIKNEDDQDVFSSSMQGLSTTCIILFSVIYYVFHNSLNNLIGLSSYLMAVMFVDMWSTSAYQFWSNRERVAYRYKKLVALTVAFTILRPLTSVFAVYNVPLDLQVEARVSIGVMVNVILFVGLFISIFKKGKRYYNLEYWKYALLFNLPLIPHYLSQIVLNQTDRIMINYFCGPAEAAYYSVAYSLAMVMLIFNSAVSSTMNPWIYRSIKEKNYKKIGDISYIILIVIAFVNFIIIALAPEVLRIMAPSSYYTAVWIIPPVTASIYFMFLYNLFATFEYYFGKTRWVMYASVLGAILNIVLNAVFIPMFGFIAAGYTTLVCYILYSLAHFYFLKKVSKDYMDGYKVYNLKIILAIGLLLIAASGLMLVLYDYILARLCLLSLAIFFAILHKSKIKSVLSILKKKEV
jgi:O-antigen/teichoic acid export membrane protein